MQMESVFQIGLSFSRAQVFGFSFLITMLWMCGCFLVFLYKQRADLADIGWGPAGGVLALSSMMLGKGHFPGVIVALCVFLWGARLGFHIYLRHQQKEEDFRYVEMKKTWGRSFKLRAFFQVFILQGVILYWVCFPIIWIQTQENIPLNINFYLALSFWITGFLIESVADYQLKVFIKNHRHQKAVCTEGLWRYSRHPNYLGELVQWYALWVITLVSPIGYFLVLSPLLLTYLIVFISGVAPLEKKMNNYQGYQEYKKRTPLLISPGLFFSLLYFAQWYFFVVKASSLDRTTLVVLACFMYGLQVWLLYKMDRKGFLIFLPFSLYFLLGGIIQESIFIFSSQLAYIPSSAFPIWILILYPLFSASINGSLVFLNRSLILSFVLGAIGSFLSYKSGETLGAVLILHSYSFLVIGFSWGILMIIMIKINRKLIKLREYYTDLKRLSEPFTIIFDLKCPVCLKEKQLCEKRVSTGVIITPAVFNQDDLNHITKAFTFEMAMQKIHGIDHQNQVFVGTKVLSEVYSRTNLPALAIILQAPGFKQIFNLLYWAWAKIRFFFRKENI